LWDGHEDALLWLNLWYLKALTQKLQLLMPDFLCSVSFSFFWGADQQVEVVQVQMALAGFAALQVLPFFLQEQMLHTQL
jgi:hypothetical protein